MMKRLMLANQRTPKNNEFDDLDLISEHLLISSLVRGESDSLQRRASIGSRQSINKPPEK